MSPARPRGLSIKERIIGRVQINTEGCWIWQGGMRSNGYASIYDPATKRGYRGHRLTYRLWRGDVPDGLELDHTCHTNSAGCPGGTSCQHRKCVNPHHLEPVTARENILRGLNHVAAQAMQTTCVNGHPFDQENTRIRTNGSRACRTCVRARNRIYEARRRKTAARHS